LAHGRLGSLWPLRCGGKVHVEDFEVVPIRILEATPVHEAEVGGVADRRAAACKCSVGKFVDLVSAFDREGEDRLGAARSIDDLFGGERREVASGGSLVASLVLRDGGLVERSGGRRAEQSLDRPGRRA
jgi:hypothetical protein